MRIISIISLIVSIVTIGCSSGGGGGGSVTGKGTLLLNAAKRGLESTGSQLSNSKSTLAIGNDCQASAAIASKEEAFELAVCLFQYNSKSPDTFQGAFHLLSEIMRASENAFVYQYKTEPTIHNGITLNLDVTAKTTFYVAVRERALEASYWNYKIEVVMGNDSSVTFEEANVMKLIFLKDSDGIIGAKMVTLDPSNAGAVVDGGALLIDYTNGTLRYENMDAGQQRHTRVYVKGTISNTGNVSAIEKIALAQADDNIEVVGGTKGALVAASDGNEVVISVASQLDGSHGAIDNACIGTVCAGIVPLTYDDTFNTVPGNLSSLSTDTSGNMNYTEAAFELNSYKPAGF